MMIVIMFFFYLLNRTVEEDKVGDVSKWLEWSGVEWGAGVQEEEEERGVERKATERFQQ